VYKRCFVFLLVFLVLIINVFNGLSLCAQSSEVQSRAADVEGGVAPAAPAPQGSKSHPMKSFLYYAFGGGLASGSK